MSIYREEAIEALVEALQRKDFPHSQILALDALLSMCAHRTSSGESYTEAWLLKMAGYNQPYHALMKSEKLIIHENELTDTMVSSDVVWVVLELFSSCFQSLSLPLHQS